VSTQHHEVDFVNIHLLWCVAHLQGLNFMYEHVRIASDDQRRTERCEIFLSFFREEGCRMVEITCEEHDRQAASTQFVTHTVGRMLGAMQVCALFLPFLVECPGNFCCVSPLHHHLPDPCSCSQQISTHEGLKHC
jgi:hypothetical protein